jgi:nitroimidazol reductase NimA-like FMN-containing flavoprotein (pyridoxamine 5'-phosphate oxidase superfamily)
MPSVKIVKAMKDVPGLDHSEIEKFLGSGTPLLRLATVDESGQPMIHPVWFYFENDRLYVWTGKDSRKARNAASNNRVYFSIDTDKEPYKGVKGKGRASAVADPNRALEIGKKIVVKYLGSLENEYAREMLEGEEGATYAIEIVPEYYTVWDYSKM